MSKSFGRQISPAMSDVCGNKYKSAASITWVPWTRQLFGELSVRFNCYKNNIYAKNVYIRVIIENVKSTALKLSEAHDWNWTSAVVRDCRKFHGNIPKF
jgi:hypothetical protein